MGWDTVEEALEDAVAITWDGCHKIYVLMDDGQVEVMRDYGYDPIVNVTESDVGLKQVKRWFDASCGLAFVSGIKSPGRNEDFTTLIAQFEFDDEERSGW